MRATILMVGLVLVFGMGACKKKAADKGPGKDHAGHMHQGGDQGQPGKVNPATGKVDIPAKGKAFKPPLKKAQVPAGAWICDMGTVHYARGKKGDGVCPLCNMKLKLWQPKAK